jgi:DNA processing protein
MLEEEKICLIALSLVPGIGARTLDRLVQEFGSASNVFTAERERLLALPRITDHLVDEIYAMGERLDEWRQELAALRDEEVQVFVRGDAGYPRNLQWAFDAPPVLFIRGQLTPDDAFAIAIVGSREASEEGVKLARTLAEQAVDYGMTVVSGLAPGIDGVAHAAALRAAGRTIGVLGSGIRVIYPSENCELAEAMIRHGAIVSELAPDARPSGANLMARDRIISGLSLGVIVVEARAVSGSADTAARAMKQQRPVWVVDWRDNDPAHAGNRAILGSGAEPLPSHATINMEAIAAVLRETERRLREGIESTAAAGDRQLRLFST